MGKGGSTTSVEIPAWLEEAARKNLEKADKISAVGSVPMSYTYCGSLYSYAER